ncbi:MAG: hypothetical protein V3T84_13725 [Phycisphaerales bacterium]
MTRQELLELAALDALGLLDRYEAALYTRSFHYASAPVQDEIVRLQAEIVSDESLLPEEEPDGSLRERVLRKVAEAIEREASEFAPLATIGRRRRHRPGESDRRSAFGASGQFWRAAAFVMAGAVVVLAYFSAEANRSSNEIARLALMDDTEQLAVVLGATGRQFVLGDNQKVTMHPAKASTNVAGAVYVNETTEQAFVFFDGLPRTTGNDYTLCVILEDGSSEDLQTFRSGGIFSGFIVSNLSASLLASITRWEITDLAGAVILTSA